MNNDLISRSTLKEDMKSRLSACNEWIEKAKDKETKIRASAVKAFIAEWLKELKAYKEKPQGEWLFVSRNCWKCPYCQELTNEGKNFCPNCGAYMRGENNG